MCCYIFNGCFGVINDGWMDTVMGIIIWRDHVTNEEVKARSGQEEALQDTVTQRRGISIIVGHILR